MSGQQVTLANGKVVVVLVGSGVREVEAFHRGRKIALKKRTTHVRVVEPLQPGQKEDEATVLAEGVVSCSHLDRYARAAGRKEAWKALLAADKKKGAGVFANREDRVRVVEVLNITPEPPRLKDKAAIKAAKAKQRQARLKKAAQAKGG